jgi:tetratricopeptide (TPR) repeat protein
MPVWVKQRIATGLWIFCALTLTAKAAETKAPGTLALDDPSRTREVFDKLLQQGTNALAATEYSAALDTLLDAKDIFEKKMRAKSSQVGSPEHVALLHGLALAYQLTQKPEKASPLFEANSPLDRACNSKGVSRQLLITRATLDATQGYLAMRTVVSLSNYLKEHPDELDSEMLDLLFTALQKADERVTNRALTLEPSMKLYEDFNTRLEATRPGQKRWGVQWVSQGTFDTEMKKRKAAIKTFEAAQDKWEQSLDAVKDAERNYEAAKRNGYATKARIDAAANKLGRARGDSYDKQKQMEDARAAIPAVPGLTKEDFKRLLTPHDVDVVVSKSGKTAVASADNASRAIPFSLGGGGNTGATPKTASTTGGGGGTLTPTPTYQPPPAAPPSRRTFSRSSAGFAVGPELFLTAASAVKGAARIIVEIPGAQPLEASVERTGDEGLALLRVKGQRLSYLNLATAFAGGAVQCPAFPEVSVFGVTMETIAGKANKPQEEGWKVALNKHPRLPGAPLLDETGNLVGIEMGDREDLRDRLPALPFGRIQSFLASDAPTQRCATSNTAAIVQITASFER